MADISKIQIESGTYDIKDETARNDINTINTNLNISNSERTILIGDSYSLDRRPSIQISGWMTKLQSLLGLNDNDCYKIQDNGGGFVASGSTGTFLNGLSNLQVTNPDTIKNIIVCGGLNDIASSKATIKTAISDFMIYAKNHFSNANVYIGMIGWRKDDNSDGQYERYLVVNNVLPAYQECSDYGAIYLNGVENVMHDCSQYYDDAHPNQLMCDRLGYYIYQSFKNGYASVTYDDHLLSFQNTNVTTTNFNITEKIVNNNTIIFDNKANGSEININSNYPTFTNDEVYIGVLNTKYLKTVYTNTNLVTCNCVIKDTDGNWYVGTGTLLLRSFYECYLKFTGDGSLQGKTIDYIKLMIPFNSIPTIMI